MSHNCIVDDSNPDYYQLLEVQTDCSTEDIRRNYRRLALKCHPDKNPNADRESSEHLFKLINEAFVTLSDPEKRHEYDMRANIIQQSGQNLNCTFWNSRFTANRDHNSCAYSSFENSSSFEQSNKNSNGKFTFSGDERSSKGNVGQNFQPSFEQNNFAVPPLYRKRKRFRGFDYGSFPKRDTEFWNQHVQGRGFTPNEESLSIFAYITPMLVIISLLILNALVESQSLFSLTQDYYYTEMRATYNKKIPYYVHENFVDSFEGSMKEFENHVEVVYKNHLHYLCQEETEYKKSNINKARYFKNNKLLAEMEQLKLPHCEQIQQYESP